MATARGRKIKLIINYDKLPTRGKETSEGEKTRKHALCGGRCYVFYDENRRYRVECENCGTLKKFRADGLDLAIKKWNDMLDAIGTAGGRQDGGGKCQ
ncbi:MAG: hypothetical protein WC364_10540 [Eubacteriales bacterium]